MNSLRYTNAMLTIIALAFSVLPTETEQRPVGGEGGGGEDDGDGGLELGLRPLLSA